MPELPPSPTAGTVERSATLAWSDHLAALRPAFGPGWQLLALPVVVAMGLSGDGVLERCLLGLAALAVLAVAGTVLASRVAWARLGTGGRQQTWLFTPQGVGVRLATDVSSWVPWHGVRVVVLTPGPVLLAMAGQRKHAYLVVPAAMVDEELRSLVVRHASAAGVPHRRLRRW